MGFTMTKNKVLVAQALLAATFLTGCGGGDSDEFVTRNVFAVGEIVNAVEDAGPVSGDVSLNDAGEGLSYALMSGSMMANGEFVFNSDGTFTYTPNPGFYGTDSVTYVVTHTASGDTATAQLTMNVENNFEALEEYGWSLEWSDEFEGTTLDETLWNGQNTSIVDGNLLISAQTAESSFLKSQTTLRSGRVEARIQLPADANAFSAFSIMPMSDMFSGDNAIIGVKGDKSGLIAGAEYGLGLVTGVMANSNLVSNSSSEFNSYAIEWGAEKIRWYFNDVHVHTADTLNLWAYNLSGDAVVVDNAGPFNQDMQVSLTLHGSGEEAPSLMMVDYIKVWSCTPTISPTTPECGSNVKRNIDSAASDRIESVSEVTTPIYTDALNELSWHYTDEVIELSIGNNNNPTITEVDTQTDRGIVIDVSHPTGDGNIAIQTPGIELIGRNAVLTFDMYIDSENTTSETLQIRMETAWPYFGFVTWNVAELELDTWVTYSIPVSEFVANPYVAPDWIGCCVQGGVEGDLLPLDTSDVGSLLTIEFYDAVHLQLDNVSLQCESNESCVQGLLAKQPEELAGGAAPIRYEAEDFDSQSGVELEDTTDEGGGQNIGFIDAGDFVVYTINAPSAGIYSLNYRLASDLGSEGFEVSIAGVVVDTQTLDRTGGWQEWVTQSSGEFTLEAGPQTLRIDFIGGAINVNWFELVPPVSEIFIQAEDFVNAEGVELEATSDEGGGENVGFTDAGDFLEYAVNIPSDGDYIIEYRLAGQNDSDGFETSFNGMVLDRQVMPSTGGWQTWVTQTGEVTLVAGEQTMRLDFIGGEVNLNWFKIIKK